MSYIRTFLCENIDFLFEIFYNKCKIKKFYLQKCIFIIAYALISHV